MLGAHPPIVPAQAVMVLIDALPAPGRRLRALGVPQSSVPIGNSQSKSSTNSVSTMTQGSAHLGTLRVVTHFPQPLSSPEGGADRRWRVRYTVGRDTENSSIRSAIV